MIYVTPIMIRKMPPKSGAILPTLFDIILPKRSPRCVIIPAVMKNIIEDKTI